VPDWIFIIIGLIIILFPFAWVLSLSIRTKQEVFTAILFPDKIRLKNYIYAWSNFDLPSLFKNSIIITFSSVVLTVFISALAGYGFAKFSWNKRDMNRQSICAKIIVYPFLRSHPLSLVELQDNSIVHN
jgi:ABC-type glycerol-3-phosphate transport system permease component